MTIRSEALRRWATKWGQHAGFAVLIVLTFGSGIDSFFDSESLAQILDVLEISRRSILNLFARLPCCSKYRPLQAGYFYLHFQVFGLNPNSYHMSNLVFHFLTVLLMYKVVGRLTRDTRTALAAAALFGIWYTHGKTVHWVEVHNFLAGGAFLFYSLDSYMGFRETSQEKKYWASLLSFLIALLFAGELGPSMLPFVILVYDLLYSSEKTWKERILRLLRPAYLLRISPYGIATLVLLSINRSFLMSLRPSPRQLVINANTFLSHLYYPFGPQGLANQLDAGRGVREVMSSLLLSGRLGSLLLMFLLSAVTAIWVLYIVVRGSQVQRFYGVWFMVSAVPLIGLSGIDPRYYYFPLMAFTPLVAVQVIKVWTYICARDRSPWIPATGLILVLCGVVSFHAIYNIRVGLAFRDLGNIVREVTDRLSQTYEVFPPNSDLYFVGLPAVSPIGINIFMRGRGIGQFVRWKYSDETLRVYEADHWPSSGGAGRRRFVFCYRNGRLMEAPTAEACPDRKGESAGERSSRG